MGIFNFLPQVIQIIEDIPDKLVTEAAIEIRDLAYVNCPEATGFLASSIYVESHTLSTYGQGMLEPPGDSFALPEIEKPPSGTAYVAVAGNYGIYVELGTRKMSAQPYLIPAAEEVRVDFEGGTLLTQLLTKELGAL